jgi:peptidoglycan/LPS O-acetylase OafA/YrhL
VFFFHSFATDYDYIKANPLYHGIKNFVFGNGNLGVNFFFVLSGFLITYLLLAEKERYGRINIPHFYIRRILRIWPLFYFCVFFGFFIFPEIKLLFGQIPNETAHLTSYIFFLNNIDFVQNGIPDSSVLGVLWSVAIEEQFYLIWPLIIGLLSLRYILSGFVLIIISTYLFRLMHAEQPDILEYHTFSCISDMTIGGFFAFLCSTKPKFLKGIETIPKPLWVLLYLAVAAIYLFRHQIFSVSIYLLALDRLIISILFAFVILEQNYAHNSFFKMSQFKFISKLGTYTYGLYCLHMIGILIAAEGLALAGLNRNVYQVIFLEGAISLSITFLLAFLSYHFYERKFLSLKDRFEVLKIQNAPRTPHTEPPGRWRPRTERNIPDQVPGSRI